MNSEGKNTKKRLLFLTMGAIFLLLICFVAAFCFGCVAINVGGEDLREKLIQTSEIYDDALLPAPMYGYYAVAAGETEIPLEIILFAPKDMAKSDLENMIIALGNTDVVAAKNIEIIEFYDHFEKVKNHNYLKISFTIDVAAVKTEVAAFKTVTIKVNGEEERLAIGEITIDKHLMSVGEGMTPSEEELWNTATAIYNGYPDNLPGGDAFVYTLHPGLVYYCIRPVSLYSLEGGDYCEFGEYASGTIVDMVNNDIDNASGSVSVEELYSKAINWYGDHPLRDLPTPEEGDGEKESNN